MDRSELKERLKQLVKDNKTEEALKLLSKAQLSDLDKVVLNLNSRFKRAKEDWMFDNISKEDSDRAMNKINQVILELSEKVESNIEENTAPVQNARQASMANEIHESDVSEPLPVSPNAWWKNKKFLYPILLAPLILLIFFTRSCFNNQEGPEEGLEKVKQSFYDDSDLLNSSDPWSTFPILYHENFSDPNDINFRNDIWNPTSHKDYQMDVENNRYVIKILKNDFAFSRHKYLGRIDYNSDMEVIPYSIKVLIDDSSDCITENNCLGRGLTVRYDNSKKSAYAYTLNDAGELRFTKLFKVFQPNSGKNLYAHKMPVQNDQTYELGIIGVGHKFHLYCNRQFITTIEDSDLKGKFNGILASGKGWHQFDDISLYRSLNH